MSVIQNLASNVGSNSDVLNKKLAFELAETEDITAIGELISGLENRDKAVQSDCIKVIYEIGYLKPGLISGYAGTFMNLLHSKNNRLVWGAMIALSTIADIARNVIFERLDLVYKAMECGSVITVDNGVKVLARVASVNSEKSNEIVGYLLRHLSTCRSSEVPQHAESTLPAINASNKDAFISVLKAREEGMTPPRMQRIRKIYRQMKNL